MLTPQTGDWLGLGCCFARPVMATRVRRAGGSSQAKGGNAHKKSKKKEAEAKDQDGTDAARVREDWQESEQEQVPSESGQGPVRGEPWSSWNDPWVKYQPTSCGEDRDARRPTREDFEAFCNWWSNHSSLESEETRSAPPEAGRSQGDDSMAKEKRQTERFMTRARVKATESRGWSQRRDVPAGEPAGDPDGSSDEEDEDEREAEDQRRKKDKKGRRNQKQGPPGPPDGGDPGQSEGGEETAPSEDSVRTSEVRLLLQQRMRASERPKSSLGSVRIEDFFGERSKYQAWKRVVCAQKALYQLQESELSMLIYISCKKEARDVLDQLTIEEMIAPHGLQRVWNLLDEAYHETSEEHFERVEGEFNSYRRIPGQSIPSYLSQIKRLKMECMREDPDSRMSDRAWAQRMLVRAALTKRERLDVFFSAGGAYVAKDIERALRHRCQRIHEEERRLPQPVRRPFSRSSSARSSTASTTSSSTWRSRSRKGNGAFMTSVEEGNEEEECEDEDLEREQEENEEDQEPEDEDQEEGDGDEEEEAITAEELKEAWAAGWRAKDQVAEKRKSRNFRNPSLNRHGPRRDDQQPDARKQATTCSSCGQKGHWKGDPQCPKVQSGEDKPFQPKNQRATKGVHFVKEPEIKPVTTNVSKIPVEKQGMTVHEVNFTFVTSTRKKEKKSHEGGPTMAHCPRCPAWMDVQAKFCSECGSSMALPPMRDQHEKRGWKLVDYDDSDAEVDSEDDPGQPSVLPAAKSMAGVICSSCGRRGHLRYQCGGRYRGGGYTHEVDETREALEELPYMSREEKRVLMRRLQQEAEEDRQQPVFPKVTSVAPGRSLTTLQPPTGEMPAALKQKRLEEFRRAMYEERVDRKGRLIPSEATTPSEEQKKCPHPWNRLRWSANAQGHFATCRACDLKNVLYWHERHGTFTSEPQAFLPKSGLLAIADSGCRAAVGGCEWHARFQEGLRMKNLSWTEVEEVEWYKFGAGEPVQSQKAYLYPVGVHGVCSYLRMSEVGGDAADCPGLVGPSDMSRWRVVFRFETKEVDAMGVTRPMQLTSTRHPGLDLLDFGGEPNFEKPELQRLLEQLSTKPHLFAFVTEEHGGESEGESSNSFGSEAEEDEADSGTSDSGQEELWELVGDLEKANLPFRKTQADWKEDEMTEEETGWSETSHEFGRQESSSEEEISEVEVEEHEKELQHVQGAFLSRIGEVCTLKKGSKRRIRHGIREIKEVMVGKTTIPRSPPMPRPTPPKKPYKVLEVFTWTMAVTMMAVGRGWIGQEPVTLPRWDLRDAADRASAYQYLVKEEPDLLVLAWPCTVWSPLQYLGHMTEERHEKLLDRQQADRNDFLSLVHEMTKFQRSRGRAHLGENPFRSRAWKEPWIVSAYEGEGCGRVDMCRYGLRRPDTKQLLQKPTRLMGTPEIVKKCVASCRCTQTHAHTLGSFKWKGRSRSVAEFAGGYTRSFARQVVVGAEEFLDHWKPDRMTVFTVYDEGVAEESMMGCEEEAPGMQDEEEVPEETAEEDIDQAVYDTVARVHQRLGHPSKDALLRMLKLSGAPKETLDCARRFKCSVCESKAPPDKPFLQRPRQRPAGFNIEVHVDLKYAKNIKEETFVALSVVCAGTNKQAAVLLKTRKPSYVAQKFIKHWIAPFGRPTRIVMDQGGEFEKEWILMLEQYGIHSTTTGSHAGWQHALAERHGALLGVCWHALVVDFRIESRHEMAISLAAAVDAKNETVTRQGFSPNMLVFGKSINYPELLADEDFDPVTMAQALDVENEMSKRSRMRNQARQVLLRDDVQQKLKRALQRRPPTQEQVYIPGQVIYFYIPSLKPRYRQDHGRWRGPAVVIIQESHQKYYVSWRGRCLLVAAPNMRPASAEESQSHGWIKDEMETLMKSFGEPGGEGKEVQDVSQQPQSFPPGHAQQPVPVEPAPIREENAQRMMRGMRTVRKLLAGSQALERQKQLGIEDGRRRQGQRRMRAIEDGSVNTHGPLGEGPRVEEVSEDDQAEREVEADQEGGESASEPEREGTEAELREGEESDQTDNLSDLSDGAFWKKVEDDEKRYWEEERKYRDAGEQLEELRLTELRREAALKETVLDDFPAQALKRKPKLRLGDEEVAKRVKTDFYAFVMLAASEHDLHRRDGDIPRGERKCNQWLGRQELRSLRRLLQLPVKAARIHYAPRKKMQKPPNSKPRSRLSVLIGQDPSMALMVQETPDEASQNPRRRAPFLWRGMTLFIEDDGVKRSEGAGSHEGLKRVYVEKEGKMFSAPWDPEKEDVWYEFLQEEHKRRIAYEVFLLRMKENGKELDPRFFDKNESDAFKEADIKEWDSWIQNGVVKELTDEEAKRVPRHKVFRIPLRWVRVNKNKDVDHLAKLQAKSRLVVPGHADPGLGDFRTDSPTTNPVSVRMVKSLAVTRDWTVMMFDVSTAFLSGYNTDREVYVRAPKDGLPATKTTTEIAPYALLRILKSAYGLAEAPRLWYLRAARMLEESGLNELPFSRSTFVKSTGGVSKVVCALHVDDGIIAGDADSAEFKTAFKKINERFNIKEWQKLGEKGADFLGCKVFREKGYIKDCMKTYVQKIEPMMVVSGKAALEEEQRTAYRRLVMQLRWPAQHVLPERLYAVSELAQKVTVATMDDARSANKLLEEFKMMAEEGLMEIRYVPLAGSPMLVSFFDASLGKSTTTRAQQGQVHLVTSEGVERVPTPANLVEYKSSKITRVVKSSLAAEGNSLSTATDEQLYLRLLCEAIWFGPPCIEANWKTQLKVPGTVVTDAKALFDHLMKTGHMTAEKQTMLDILAAKQLIEGTAMKVAWVPTFRQMADGLTKCMNDELFKKYKIQSTVCLKETEEDAKVEAHRAGLRRGQRERRKQRMQLQKSNTNTSSP